MTRGGIMEYQLSAGCGHGGLCGSTSAGSGFKEKAFPFFQHKKGHWPAAFSSVAFNGPDRERAGQRFGAWAWHGRRREVGVSEISGVRSGAPSPCRRSSLRCRPALWRISGDRHKLLLLRGDTAVTNLPQSCFSSISQISSLQLGASLASLFDHAPWFASSPAQYT